LAKAAYLSPEEARRLYDRVGRWQDTQSFYERRATNELIALARMEEARAVLEFGCGTGAFGADILAHHLTEQARYVGLDVSPVMVDLASRRLRPWSPRAQVRRADGSMQLPFRAETFDRVVANYVLDLLSPADACELLREARRVLAAGGLVCVTSLSSDASGFASLLARTWEQVWRLRPRLVGGCRPIRVTTYLPPSDWVILGRRIVTSFGVPSEVLVARRAE
jgi:ubiquinone/menaquinone biosynthesis C-methylase UbiE